MQIPAFSLRGFCFPQPTWPAIRAPLEMSSEPPSRNPHALNAQTRSRAKRLFLQSHMHTTKCCPGTLHSRKHLCSHTGNCLHAMRTSYRCDATPKNAKKLDESDPSLWLRCKAKGLFEICRNARPYVSSIHTQKAHLANNASAGASNCLYQFRAATLKYRRLPLQKGNRLRAGTNNGKGLSLDGSNLVYMTQPVLTATHVSLANLGAARSKGQQTGLSLFHQHPASKCV